MNYAILWILALAFSVLVIALLCAWVARRRRWLTGMWRYLVPSLATLSFAGLGVWGVVLSYRFAIPSTDWRVHAISWTLAHSLGAVTVIIVGLRVGPGNRGQPNSTSWPPVPLGWGSLLLGLLAVLQFFWIDLGVKRDLDAVLNENIDRRDSFLPKKPAGEDDAAPLYRQAFQSVENWPEWDYDVCYSDFNVKHKAVRAFVQNTDDVMPLMREALDKPACHLMRGKETEAYSGCNLASEDARWISHLPRVAALHARYNASVGNLHVARDALRVIESFSRRVASDATNPIAFLMAAGWTSLLKATAEGVLAELPSPRQAALLDALPARPSFSTRAREMLEMDQVLWFIDFARGDRAPLLRVFIVPGVLEGYRRAFARIQVLSASPYHEVRERLEEFDRPLEEQHGWGVLECGGAALILKRVAKYDADHRLARLGLAVAAFRAQRGSYPKTLGDLLPDFLDAIPTDPGDGKPLKLLEVEVEVEDGLVLYSVGPEYPSDRVKSGGERVARDVAIKRVWTVSRSGEHLDSCPLRYAV